MTDVDAVFRAMADPTRRRVLDRLFEHDGLTLGELCAGLEMSRQAVSKHLALLEAAGLVATRRRGREKLHHLDPVPIQEIHDRWIGKYERARVRAITALRTALEESPMSDDRTYLYTTYIATTPEKVYEALTTPEFTMQYWGGAEVRSDWRVGSPVEAYHPDHDEWLGEVVAAEPPHRLAYTFTGAAERAEGRPATNVEFAIQAFGEQVVKLTVTHTGFTPDEKGAKDFSDISGGWPAILSALKTLLESGSPLPTPAPFVQRSPERV